MGTTPKYQWPYPELTDPPDGAAQIKALATSIETTVNGGQPWARFTNLTTVNNVATGATTLTQMKASGASAGQAPWIVNPDPTYLICKVPGTYLVVLRQYVTTAAARSLGCVSVLVDFPADASLPQPQWRTPQGGSTFFDAQGTFVMGFPLPDSPFRWASLNESGGPVNLGAATAHLIRIGA